MLRALSIAFACTLAGSLAFATSALAQTAMDAERIDSQREALAPLLERMAGEWRGTAEVRSTQGAMSLVQTERVGPMLDGSVIVVEGAGYAEDGSRPFNAFAVIAYDPGSETYSIRSFANGRYGEYPLWPTEDGFRWEIEAGPATIRYVATVDGETWHEVGTYEREGAPPTTFIEMHLTRIGDSDWPAGGAVEPID